MFCDNEINVTTRVLVGDPTLSIWSLENCTKRNAFGKPMKMLCSCSAEFHHEILIMLRCFWLFCPVWLLLLLLEQCYFRGLNYDHGKRVSPRHCLECECVNGSMQCRQLDPVVHCPALSCPPSEQFTVANECCKQCPGKLNHSLANSNLPFWRYKFKK